MNLDHISLESANATFFFLISGVLAFSVTVDRSVCDANFPFFFPFAAVFNSFYT